MEIAYAPKLHQNSFFSARLRGFSGQKRMIFPGRTVRQKTCRIKPKLDQYILSKSPCRITLSLIRPTILSEMMHYNINLNQFVKAYKSTDIKEQH